MSIRIIVNGAFGRMGQLAAKAIAERKDFELVGQTGREYDLKKAIQDSKADVVLDLTAPDSVFNNANMILEAGARPVIGTSGLTSEQIKLLEKKCAELKRGALIVPNFSLGGVLMMKFAKEIVKYMPNVEIIEMHHANKLDSPSGTAMRSADMMADACSTINPDGKSSHETVSGARGGQHRGIPIHAIRLPGLLAHQQIIFGGIGETLTLKHDSIDRQCFMPGICLACEKVMGLEELVCGLGEVL